jgi:regulator of sigma E protease
METIISVFSYLLPFILVISVIVGIHEFGHFFVARRLGIHVTDFSIGMGPMIANFIDSKGCRWQIRALPLGGYVKMAGDEDASSTTSANPELFADKTDEEKRGLFCLRPVPHRAAVILAGPIANFILGLFIISSLYMYHGRPYTPPVVSEVIAGDVAEKAGLQVGDVILKIDGSNVDRFEQVAQIVSENPGKPMALVVRRGQQEVPLSITPRIMETTNRLGMVGKTGRIGIAGSEHAVLKVGVTDALIYGAEDVYHITNSTLRGLKEIVLGERPLSDLSGPVKIAELSGRAAKVGWDMLVFLAAVISINLGVMNLLPIPILDGGHLILYLIEAVKGSPPNPKVVERVYQGSFILIMCFFLAITVNDVLDLLHRTILAN